MVKAGGYGKARDVGEVCTSMRRLRVGVLGINYEPEQSGIAPYTAGLSQGLAKLGHEVSVLTSRPHYPEWRVPVAYRAGGVEDVAGVRVRRLRHYIPTSPSGLKRVAFEATFGARLATSRWHGPDVIVCVSPALVSSAIAIARARLSPHRPAIGLIVQDLYSRGVREIGFGGSGLASAATRLEGSVIRACDGVSVIHDRFKQRIVEDLRVPPDRVSVIRNWCHIESPPAVAVDASRSALGWGDETVVLHAGAMGAKQGLENVVDAARLSDQAGSRVRFVLVGDGSRRHDLERRAEGVRSLEFRDQVSPEDFGRVLASADILLVNERPEVSDMAVPSKLTSYFRSGRPVLAATDGASTTAGELSAAGAGVRVDPGDPAALLQAALELAKDRERSREFGEQGRRYCDQVLSEDVAIDKYDEWITSLAARRLGTAV
jgi:colanic acid biosynthesis glycosyl transferase WcaI